MSASVLAVADLEELDKDVSAGHLYITPTGTLSLDVMLRGPAHPVLVSRSQATAGVAQPLPLPMPHAPSGTITLHMQLHKYYPHTPPIITCTRIDTSVPVWMSGGFDGSVGMGTGPAASGLSHQHCAVAPAAALRQIIPSAGLTPQALAELERRDGRRGNGSDRARGGAGGGGAGGGVGGAGGAGGLSGPSSPAASPSPFAMDGFGNASYLHVSGYDDDTDAELEGEEGRSTAGRSLLTAGGGGGDLLDADGDGDGDSGLGMSRLHLSASSALALSLDHAGRVASGGSPPQPSSLVPHVSSWPSIPPANTSPHVWWNPTAAPVEVFPGQPLGPSPVPTASARTPSPFAPGAFNMSPHPPPSALTATATGAATGAAWAVPPPHQSASSLLASQGHGAAAMGATPQPPPPAAHEAWWSGEPVARAADMSDGALPVPDELHAGRGWARAAQAATVAPAAPVLIPGQQVNLPMLQRGVWNPTHTLREVLLAAYALAMQQGAFIATAR